MEDIFGEFLYNEIISVSLAENEKEHVYLFLPKLTKVKFEPQDNYIIIIINYII